MLNTEEKSASFWMSYRWVVSKEDLETEAFRKGKKNITCRDDREVRRIRTGHKIKNKFLRNMAVAKMPWPGGRSEG